MSVKLKPKKDSLVALSRKYSNNPQACIQFFFNSKWPEGFYCEKCQCVHYYRIERHNVFQCSACGHQHYLFAGTIFEDNKLDLYKLILGLFLFFSSNKGVSAIELASQLEVNYKTALLLARKCRILMAESCSDKIMDSLFYEADVAYIGAKSTGEGRQGCGTEQQSCLFLLSTEKENNYPQYIKIFCIPTDNSNHTKNFINKSIRPNKDSLLNTDGKNTFDCMKEFLKVKNEKILYHEEFHRLKWLNIAIGNIKNNIDGIYHGLSKRDMPLFLKEQEWRYNHRYTGKNIMNKIQTYILKSTPCPRKKIITALNLAEPYFSKCV